MNPDTPNLLPPERLAEIRKLPQQLAVWRGDFAPSAPTSSERAITDLLAHIDAVEANARLVLGRLLLPEAAMVGLAEPGRTRERVRNLKTKTLAKRLGITDL